MANERLESTSLTLETAKELTEMIEESQLSLKEIGKAIKVHGNTLNAWITESLFGINLDQPHATLRTALIQRVLKDTVILGMLKAAETPSRKTSRKTVILSELSKADRTLLEKKGHEAVLDKLKDAIVLKVEETVEVIPPQSHLYKEILKALDNGEVENPQKNLTDFFQPHPDLPPV